jgi:hypothetical protein
MRIVFTVKIAPIYSEADVSHNALFIGLWTEAEVTLGFIVACALCLPKLIQAKGGRLKRVMSKASSPFSTMRSGTFNMGSRKGTKLSTVGSVRSVHLNKVNTGDLDIRSVPEQNNGRLDPSAFKFPSTAASSSYSANLNSERDISRDPSPGRLAPLHVARNSITGDMDLALRSPTHRATRDLMSPEQLQAEVNSMQQFRFEAELRESMEGAQKGVSPGHTHVY